MSYPTTMPGMKKLVTKLDGALFRESLKLQQLQEASAAFLYAVARYSGRSGVYAEYDALRDVLEKQGSL